MQKAVHASLQLLGNVSAHFNVERWKEVTKHLSNDIKFLAETEFSQSSPYLFGDNFGTKAKTVADNITSEPSKVYNPTTRTVFSVLAAPTRRKNPCPGVTEQTGTSPQNFINQSSTGWESHNLMDNRDRSSSTRQRTRRQSSEAILDRGSDPLSFSRENKINQFYMRETRKQ